MQAAKGIAFVHGKPLVPVHHIAGHIEAPFLAHGEIPLPALALVVSGGHTSLFEVPARGDYRLRGRTRDDAAGEAFDKVAKLLGLGYPGGPVIDRLSQGANDRARRVHGRAHQGRQRRTSRSAASRPRCSTTSAARASRRWPTRRTCPGEVRDLVASFQRAVVTALRAAAERRRPRSCGRAACCSPAAWPPTRLLRAEAARAAEELGLPLFVPPIALSTDNAAMIGAAGFVNFAAAACARAATSTPSRTCPCSDARRRDTRSDRRLTIS